jgi:hypothetical protein
MYHTQLNAHTPQENQCPVRINKCILLNFKKKLARPSIRGHDFIVPKKYELQRASQTFNLIFFLYFCIINVI